jgi:hypothetical protein
MVGKNPAVVGKAAQGFAAIVKREWTRAQGTKDPALDFFSAAGSRRH